METLIPIALFIFVSTITPGPNNLMLAASGLNFGLRATLPHIMGIHLGLYTLIALSAWGLGVFILTVPEIMYGLKIFASVYLVYLAWKILGFYLGEKSNGNEQPLSTWQAWLFQFINPKAWVMTSSAIALALPTVNSITSVILILCLGWATIGFLSNLCWVLAGTGIRHKLNDNSTRQWVNGGLALLIVVTVGLFWLY